MARTAILLTLIAATLLGPLSCCCAFSVDCPSFRAPPELVKVAGACPHCKPATPDSPKPTKSKHDCPVCAERVTAASHIEVKPAPVPDAPAFVAWLPLETYLPAEPAGVRGIDVRPAPDARTFLLDSCHRLRC